MKPPIPEHAIVFDFTTSSYAVWAYEFPDTEQARAEAYKIMDAGEAPEWAGFSCWNTTTPDKDRFFVVACANAEFDHPIYHWEWPESAQPHRLHAKHAASFMKLRVEKQIDAHQGTGPWKVRQNFGEGIPLPET